MVDGVSKLIFMSHQAELRFGCVEVGVELGLCNCAITGTMWQIADGQIFICEHILFCLKVFSEN